MEEPTVENREELLRLMKVFADLVLEGKVPEE
jgi:hypothetical protein